MASDQVRRYAVEPWQGLGFGVPAFGENIVTLNRGLWKLVDETGKAQLGIMTHPDARRYKPPSSNTVKRLFKVLARVHSILSGRAKHYSEDRLEGGHSSPNQHVWNIHPVPYFNSPMLRNGWLLECNDLCMVGLANCMQHSDNVTTFEVTKEFAEQCWQYFFRMKCLLGTELLLEEPEVVKTDEWWPQNDPAYWNMGEKAYDPLKVVTSFEYLDEPGPLVPSTFPTEDALMPLKYGIRADVIATADPPPVIYPTVPSASGGGSSAASATAAGGGEGPALEAPEV